MKIAHYNYCLHNGGIETMLVNIANKQVESGHDVSIVLHWNLIDEGLRKRLNHKIKLVLINRPRGSVNPLYFLKINYYLWKLNADVYHFHSARLIEGVFIPMVRRKACLTQHSNCSLYGSSSLIKFKYVFAISENVKMDIFNTFKKEAITLYNGIDPSLIRVRETKYNADDNLFHIVCLGRLMHEIKGQHILLKAVHELKKIGINNISLDIIGDGHSRQYLEELTERQGILANVHFFGNMSQTYVHEHLCKYDLLVQPSILEGFGLTIVEAMAAKVPVLVSDSSGLMEVIENGKYGFSFHNADSLDCAKKIHYIIENYPNNEVLEIAYKKVLTSYNVAVTANKYLECYRTMF